MMKYYNIKNLSYRIQDKSKAPEILLKNINLEIVPNETTAFLQTAGNSVSLLMQILAGKYFPTEGTIQLKGNQPATFETIQLLIPTIPAFMPDQATVSDYLTSSPQQNYNFISWFRKKPDNRLRDAFYKLYSGQENFPGKLLKDLLPHEILLMSVMPALLQHPEILLIDLSNTPFPESTTGTFVKAVQKLNSLIGATLLFSTSSPRQAFHLARHIYVFDSHSIISKFENSHQETETLHQLFALTQTPNEEYAASAEAQSLIAEQFI